MSSQHTQDDSAQPSPARVLAGASRRWREFEANLSNNITPFRAFLVVFYALWVVGGLLQTDFGRTGKPTSPHAQDSGQAEVSEFEAEGKVELQLFALSPTWVVPSFEVAAIPVLDDRQPVNSIQLHTVSLLRGPPAV
ncbi:hypothetical protein [Bremerella cremea]|uniref:hypothetical protein n=1 Tax=Bremerella cremea TaxID=1031537 RepID=UPI0031EA6D41